MARVIVGFTLTGVTFFLGICWSLRTGYKFCVVQNQGPNVWLVRYKLLYVKKWKMCNVQVNLASTGLVNQLWNLGGLPHRSVFLAYTGLLWVQLLWITHHLRSSHLPASYDSIFSTLGFQGCHYFPWSLTPSSWRIFPSLSFLATFKLDMGHILSLGATQLAHPIWVGRPKAILSFTLSNRFYVFVLFKPQTHVSLAKKDLKYRGKLFIIYFAVCAT